MNTFGKLFRLTTFGESHGPAIGGVVDGIPAGIAIDIDAINAETARRRPGQSSLTTQRNESDTVTILSGLLDGVTTGAPIAFIIDNTNQRSGDYAEVRTAYRPNHADYTYDIKYRGHADIRGGGRSSARETAVRVVAGALARQTLAVLSPGLTISTYTRSVGTIKTDIATDIYPLSAVDANPVRCPDSRTAQKMSELIAEVRNDGDTIGGVVECVIDGCPVGLGEPLYDKLEARLAAAMLGINATKGFEVGAGFFGSTMRGSQSLDNWLPDGLTSANHSGGIQGGLSNGLPIVMRVAFKPVATLLKPVETIDRDGRPAILQARGRHDPCVVPRAVPVVEAMALITILDFVLLDSARQNVN